MVKKMRRVRTFARTATKSQEKHLVQNAKNLQKNPQVILPEQTGDCAKYFKKTASRLEKVHRYNNSPKKLEKIARKRGLDAALAGTLLLADAEKAPYLGVVKFPTGDITYAQRGNAEKEKLIAVQHYDDPVLRLLGIKDIASKKKLYVYSWDNGYVCTGTQPQPPKPFVDFIITSLDLDKHHNVVSCPHIDSKKAQNSELLNTYYIRLHWKSADIIIAICNNCTRKSNLNTLFSLSKYMLTPDLTTDFSIKVIAEAIKQQKTSTSHDTHFLDEYSAGKLTDHEFITRNVNKQKKEIKESDEKILILDGVSYGTDQEKFLNKLQPTETERAGLEYILDKIQEPVIVTQATPNKVLEMYWNDYGKELIASLIDNTELADSFYNLDDTPSEILETVFEYKKQQRILSQLPTFTSLPPLASFADHITRTYKTFGKKQTLIELKKRPDTTKAKSLTYAFLLALGKGADMKWKFSQVEIEYGEFLKEYALKLLDADPKNYTAALQDLLTASGSSETVK